MGGDSQRNDASLEGGCACGSPLSYASERWPGQVHLLAGAFDTPAALTPRLHVYVKDRLPWVDIADGLPQHEATPSGS